MDLCTNRFETYSPPIQKYINLVASRREINKTSKYKIKGTKIHHVKVARNNFK